ncbi:hypothetical protein JTB14_008168 [Gonioctena quinquepunctata]|nr:hypothetical protein JTB14_008168 [Gonioctena quinquepunctata]
MNGRNYGNKRNKDKYDSNDRQYYSADNRYDKKELPRINNWRNENDDERKDEFKKREKEAVKVRMFDTELQDSYDKEEEEKQIIGTYALLDTGCQVSCISPELFDDLKKFNRSLQILPVSGVTVIGATGGQSKRVVKQVYLEINLGKLKL